MNTSKWSSAGLVSYVLTIVTCDMDTTEYALTYLDYLRLPHPSIAGIWPFDFCSGGGESRVG